MLHTSDVERLKGLAIQRPKTGVKIWASSFGSRLGDGGALGRGVARIRKKLRAHPFAFYKACLDSHLNLGLKRNHYLRTSWPPPPPLGLRIPGQLSASAEQSGRLSV